MVVVSRSRGGNLNASLLLYRQNRYAVAVKRFHFSWITLWYYKSEAG